MRESISIRLECQSWQLDHEVVRMHVPTLRFMHEKAFCIFFLSFFGEFFFLSLSKKFLVIMTLSLSLLLWKSKMLSEGQVKDRRMELKEIKSHKKDASQLGLCKYNIGKTPNK